MAVSEQTLMAGQQIDQLSINTIRTRAMDAVQQANSGHPGTPMALAPIAYTLWQQFLRYDPADPTWPNRPLLCFPTPRLHALLCAGALRAFAA
jgi:transketolase